VVKDEQLRKAETRITELEKQLQEARDELAGTQQERDDALATIHQLRQDNTRLQRVCTLSFWQTCFIIIVEHSAAKTIKHDADDIVVFKECGGTACVNAKGRLRSAC